MASPLLLDIVTFLNTSGVVTGDGTDAFRDFTPEEPDTAIVLVEYQGDPALPYDEGVHRSVQVISRAKDADTARQRAVLVYKTLKAAQSSDGKISFTSTRWGQVYFRQTPFFFKRDGNNRTSYAFNLGITTTIE